jgi:hypothetical protein
MSGDLLLRPLHVLIAYIRTFALWVILWNGGKTGKEGNKICRNTSWPN